MDNTQYAQRLLSLLAQGATLCATDRKKGISTSATGIGSAMEA
ncbi:hypothetical protein N5938_12935 [Pseudomonas aeruginosa]|nr:hypothetical protein [Pseudomonas aeruginosa]UYM63744.1 hypothetical protein N5938_12935 [Pseudomonas aeruginosa]